MIGYYCMANEANSTSALLTWERLAQSAPSSPALRWSLSSCMDVARAPVWIECLHLCAKNSATNTNWAARRSKEICSLSCNFVRSSFGAQPDTLCWEMVCFGLEFGGEMQVSITALIVACVFNIWDIIEE